MTYSRQFPKTIITSKTSIPDEPDFSVTNPLKKNVFCNGVEIVCSPEFTRKGAVVIKVDGITQFDSRNTNGFLRVAKLPVTINTPMKRDVIVDVFVFNEIDSNEISCSVTVFLSEESKNLDSSLQYISDETVNALVSESQILFPLRTYNNEIVTKLIDMKGYKKIIILIHASTIVPISQLTDPITNSYSIGSAGGYQNVFTDSVTGLPINQSEFDDKITNTIFDSQNQDPKNLVLTLSTRPTQTIFAVTRGISSAGSNDCGKTALEIKAVFTSKWDVVESNDPNFIIDVSTIFTDVDPSVITAGFPTTKRYIRLTENTKVEFLTLSSYAGGRNNCRKSRASTVCVFGCNNMSFQSRNIPNTTITSILDDITTDGIAKLTFEVRNPETGVFQELIDENEFGTIAQGESITVQIGDVITKSISGQTYSLPSTQTDFRGKLVVTGGIVTGVALQKIL